MTGKGEGCRPENAVHFLRYSTVWKLFECDFAEGGECVVVVFVQFVFHDVDTDRGLTPLKSFLISSHRGNA